MIAVFVNEEGNSASLSENGMIRVYKKEENGWNIVREIPFGLKDVKGIEQARSVMMELMQKLNDCKVFLAKEVAGQLYYVLESYGFESFEIEGNPEHILDKIWVAAHEIQDKKEKMITPIKPEEYFEKLNKEGYYLLNLKRALNLDCSLSSKRLLLPFLHKKEFVCLEVICDHVPKWFETELKAMGLIAEVELLKENEFKVRISS